jgi:hypothetical protein
VIDVHREAMYTQRVHGVSVYVAPTRPSPAWRQVTTRVVQPWSVRGSLSYQLKTPMSTTNSANRLSAQPITGHIAKDVLRLYREGRPDYRRVADLTRLSKEDLSKLAKVAKSSVRFDDAIPAAVAERLREIANIANLVAEYFDGDAGKVGLWFELPNPMLGHVSPATMIRGNRCRRLLSFVLEAREAEVGFSDAARKRA